MKPMRYCLIALLSLCMLLLAGCGEKESFDKAHAEVIKLSDQAQAIDRNKDLKIRSNDDLTPNKEDIKAVEDDLAATEKKHQAVMDQINAKLDEMQGYADKEASLAPQLARIRQEVKMKNDQWQAGMNEIKAITKMKKESGGKAPIYDPFKGHLNFDV